MMVLKDLVSSPICFQSRHGWGYVYICKFIYWECVSWLLLGRVKLVFTIVLFARVLQWRNGR